MTDISDLLRPLVANAPPPVGVPELARRVAQRRRRRRAGAVGGVLAAVIAVTSVTVALTRPEANVVYVGGLRSAAPPSPHDPTQAASLLLETSTVEQSLPGSHLKPARNGNSWGIDSLGSVPGAKFAVTRQWNGPTTAITLSGGPRFSKEVVSIVARFSTSQQAARWATSSLNNLRAATPVKLSGPGSIGLQAVKLPYVLNFGTEQYVAEFTMGPVTSALEMVATNSPSDQTTFSVLVQAWLTQLSQYRTP